MGDKGIYFKDLDQSTQDKILKILSVFTPSFEPQLINNMITGSNPKLMLTTKDRIIKEYPSYASHLFKRPRSIALLLKENFNQYLTDTHIFPENNDIFSHKIPLNFKHNATFNNLPISMYCNYRFLYFLIRAFVQLTDFNTTLGVKSIQRDPEDKYRFVKHLIHPTLDFQKSSSYPEFLFELIKLDPLLLPLKEVKSILSDLSWAPKMSKKIEEQAKKVYNAPLRSDYYDISFNLNETAKVYQYKMIIIFFILLEPSFLKLKNIEIIKLINANVFKIENYMLQRDYSIYTNKALEISNYIKSLQ